MNMENFKTMKISDQIRNKIVNIFMVEVYTVNQIIDFKWPETGTKYGVCAQVS